MKQIIIAFLLVNICVITQSWGSNLDARIEMLTEQLKKLESEYAIKTEELTQCEQELKKFKIAGISTIGLTGVGVGVNISLSEKIKAAKNNDSVSGFSGKKSAGASADTRSAEQISNDNQALFAEFDIE